MKSKRVMTMIAVVLALSLVAVFATGAVAQSGTVWKEPRRGVMVARLMPNLCRPCLPRCTPMAPCPAGMNVMDGEM